ncbi:MAG: glycerophosphodiester phosphodiesterase [Chloroflexi bacterium]|nr:MAG: glycerophosphodiester phosphodiesterase [Chloroflexota bacterium]
MIHNIAHRGASAYEPENTLRAFDRAIAMGATMLELDVHLSRDGRLIVSHAAELPRTGGPQRRIRDMTLEQIKRLDAGQGEQVPTLPEVIELVRGRAELYIELKGQRTPEPVVKALKALNFANQVITGSFYLWLSQRVKFLAPAIRTSALIGQENRQADFVAWAEAVEADYVHLCWEKASPTPHELLTPGLLAGIRRHGLGLILWHEERPAELRELVKLDVDGICTNTPDILSKILQEKTTE